MYLYRLYNSILNPIHMNTLLENVVKEASTLPEEEQVKLAKIWHENVVVVQKHMHTGTTGKWEHVVQRVQNGSHHLGKYSKTFKKNLKDFREGCVFKHD